VSPVDPVPGLPPVGAPELDRGRLDALRRLAPGAAGRGEAARELEVVFLTELVRAMRRTVPESGLLPQSPARSVYEGVFDRAVAEAMAAGDPLGLVERLGAGAGAGLKVGPVPADKPTGTHHHDRQGGVIRR
jgi:flagellar protein FlgJ